MERIEGGVTAPKGFFAAGVEADIKYTNRKDLALLFSKAPCTVGGVFTKNVVKAAPVTYDRALVKSGAPLRALVVNSGIANACTGEMGETAVLQTAKAAAALLHIPQEEVAVSSTGVIGVPLPVDRVEEGLKKAYAALSDSMAGGSDAARAIITTDTHEKEIALRFTVGETVCTIGAMAKGSGMIHPDMGTMLCFVTCDVSIEQALLQEAVEAVVKDTFNMISVDGDTSTNDTLMVFANGAAFNTVIAEKGAAYDAFYEALFTVCEEMAKALAGDGEGANALFEVRVINADTKEHARTLARSVIASSLTKAAIFGHDANWGRILSALGYAGVSFDPAHMTLTLLHPDADKRDMVLFDHGVPTIYNEQDASDALSREEVTVICDMHMGEEEATAWGCDLSYDYVRINADYRS